MRHRVDGNVTFRAFLVLLVLAAPVGAQEVRDVLDRAATRFEQRDYAGARSDYEQATKLDPGSIPAWVGLGWSLWQLGERDRAFQVWTEVAKVRSDDPEILLALAQAHEYREDWAESLAFYTRVLERQPTKLPARMGRARVSHRLGRYSAAEQDLKALIARDPKDFDAQFLLATIYKETGRQAEAERIFDRLARQRPDPEHLRAMADVMLELGRAKEAIDYYRQNLRRVPGNRGTLLGLARAHAQLHEYGQSVSYLETFLAQHPDDAKIREELARFASYGGDYAKAERHLRELVREHPAEIKWHLSLARVLQEKGEIEEPIAIARDILAREPNNVEALDLLLENALFNGRMEESIQWLERLVAVQPNAIRMNQLGDLYLALGEKLKEKGDEEAAQVAFARSAETFRRAIPLAPDSADSNLGVATALRLKGDYEEAIEAARGVLVRFPNLERAQRELYESYAGLGRYDEAEALLRSTLAMFPGNRRLVHELARMRFKKGDRAGAIEMVRGLLEGQGARGVPVLLYHGVSEASTREDTMPIDNFRDQMLALKRAGYTSITIRQLIDFYAKGAPLPEKPVFITFDDARADSFRYADPVLAEVGFRATMFVPVAEVGKHGPFNAVWSTLLEKHRTGRWDLQCHSYEGHRPIPLGPDGKTGAFLANRMWLADRQRLETRAEFMERLEKDYRQCGQELMAKARGLKLVGYAYPFGEMGQKTFANEPAAVETNKSLAVRYFQVGFVQDPASAVTRGTGAPVLPRFEVPWNYRGEDLLRHLRSIDPQASSELLLADLYAWDGRFAEAHAIYDRVAAAGGIDRAELLTRRGRVLLWQGDLASARDHLMEAHALRPDDRLIRESVSGLELRTSPEGVAEGLYYSDNRDRSNLSVGPSGRVYLTDQVSLGAAYRFKQFVHNDFDSADLEPSANGASAAGPSDDGTSGDAQALASRVDLETIGNEVEAELTWNRDWRNGIAVSGGVVQFEDRSSSPIFEEPDPFPLASATVTLGLGDDADLVARGMRTYVGAAGAILDDLGASGGEGQLEVRPLDGTSVQGRYLFYHYDDGNQRNTGIARLLQRIWERPGTRVRVGYRFTFDDAREEDPFFYTPDQFLGNDGLLELTLEPAEVFSLSAETALGVGQERQADSEFQASVVGTGRLNLNERFSLFASAGRSQAAQFESFQASGGISVTF